MHWNLKLVLTAAWVMAGTCLYVVVPTAAQLLLPLTVVVPLLWLRQGNLFQLLAKPSLLVMVLVAAAAYLLSNAIRTSAPTLAFTSTAILLASAAILLVVLRTMPLLERDPVRAMAIGFHAGYAAVALLMCIEIVFHNPIHTRVFSAFPRIAPQMDGIVIRDGIVAALPPHLLNTQIAALTFLFWPALLVASALGTSTRARAAAYGCLAPVLPAVFASEHETSMVAMAGSAAVFCMLSLASRVGRPLVTAGWTLACLAAVPLGLAAYDLGLQHARWLPASAQHRIVIWRVTAEMVSEAPLLGHGMVSARAIGLKAMEHPILAPGTPFPLSPGPSAHSVYLQVWFDAGAIGAALLLVVGLLVLAALARAPPRMQPMLYAAFVADALLAATSYSIWARWFLASFVLSAIFAVLAWKFAKAEHAV
jgi:O-antigen ligase